MRLVVIGAFWYFVSSLILIFSFFYLTNYSSSSKNKTTAPVNAYIEKISLSNPSTTPMVQVAKPINDIRIVALTKFLRDYDSPLVEVVDELIKQADLWGIDYALIPAIAMQESQGCKNIPSESHNCWGFGIYGEKITKFTSYQQAIAQIAKTIKETYIKNDLTNVTLLEDRWAPQSRGQWSSAVNYFIGKIREYERNSPNT